jgi:hypothetical protein
MAFRILHATDLHFATFEASTGFPEVVLSWLHGEHEAPHLLASYAHDLADALADFAYRNREKLDLIVLTGDIATTGDPADQLLARQLVLSPPEPGRGYVSVAGTPTLAAAGKPIVLLPGNHDRYGEHCQPGARTFDATFGTHWSAGQGAQLLWPATMAEVPAAPVVMIGADFTLRPGARTLWPIVGRFGFGQAYPEVVEQLMELTREVSAMAPGTPILWSIHFDPGKPVSYFLRLLDAEHLSDVVPEALGLGVEAMLCGHTHASTLPGDPAGFPKAFFGMPVLVCGTTTQSHSAKRNYLHVLELDDDTLTLMAFCYDPAWSAESGGSTARFVADGVAGTVPLRRPLAPPVPAAIPAKAGDGRAP